MSRLTCRRAAGRVAAAGRFACFGLSGSDNAEFRLRTAAIVLFGSKRHAERGEIVFLLGWRRFDLTALAVSSTDLCLASAPFFTVLWRAVPFPWPLCSGLLILMCRICHLEFPSFDRFAGSSLPRNDATHASDARRMSQSMGSTMRSAMQSVWNIDLRRRRYGCRRTSRADIQRRGVFHVQGSAVGRIKPRRIIGGRDEIRRVQKITVPAGTVPESITG